MAAIVFSLKRVMLNRINLIMHVLFILDIYATDVRDLQVLKERIAWLEAANEDLCRELHEYRSKCPAVEQRERDAQVCATLFLRFILYFYVATFYLIHRYKFEIYLFDYLFLE